LWTVQFRETGPFAPATATTAADATGVVRAKHQWDNLQSLSDWVIVACARSTDPGAEPPRMEPMTIVIPGLQAIIAFQCLLFALYLVVGNKLGRLANRINLALLLVLAVHMVFNLFNQHLSVDALPPIAFGFGLMYGPFILLYIRSLTYRDFRWRGRYFVHFAPGLLLALVASQVPTLWVAVATFVSMGSYLYLSYRALARFRGVLRQTQSAQDLIAMNWAKYILLLNAAGLLLNIVSVVMSAKLGSNNLAALAEISLFLVLLVMVNAFIFKGLLQPELFAGITADDEAIARQSAAGVASQELSAERQLQIQQSLLAHMSSRRPYLDPLFSLSALGRQLGETPRYVSQVINAHLGMNFSDFVNGYRIDEAKQRLADVNSPQTVLEILYACGFSTKSNFNRAFKQQVGMTPSEYRKSLGAPPMDP
jgi:AraC-like DNA-binding protein